MSTAEDFASGKGHTDENFPVASFLIRPRYRASILAFYRFARAADDVADHPTAKVDDKLNVLNGMRLSLLGESDVSQPAANLRAVLVERGMAAQHGLDLLEAFRRDVTKLRYADWDDLMEYCRYSAMPVGRFVLDVHGEDRGVWPVSDALCAALQVINHLQDCGKDYRALDRVYIPQDALAAAGIGVEALGAAKALPALLSVISGLARRNVRLLAEARPFAGRIKDGRLGLEVSVIQRLAEHLNTGLLTRDPLSQIVHHGKPAAFGLAILASARFLGGRLRPRKPPMTLVSKP